METAKLKSICQSYASVMNEISLRTLYAGALHSGKISIGQRFLDYESAAVNFRKIAELIIFANLIGHEDEYSALYPNYTTDWNIGQIINKIKKINPDYYPKALRGVADQNGSLSSVEDSPSGEWITEDELKDMWGKCSDLIHARNPFLEVLNLDEYAELFNYWGKKINELLSRHMIRLADNTHLIMCVMNPNGTRIPEVNIFQEDIENMVLRPII